MPQEKGDRLRTDHDYRDLYTTKRLARAELRASLFLTRKNPAAGATAALRNPGMMGLSWLDDGPAFTRLGTPQRRVLRGLVRGPVSPEAVSATLSPDEWENLIHLLRTVALAVEETSPLGYVLPEDDERERLRLILSVSSLHALGKILLAGNPLNYFALRAGSSPHALKKLLADIEPGQGARLVVLLFERLAFHGCHIPPVSLGRIAELVYQTNPLELTQEAGGREALADIFVFSGLEPPWEREAREREARQFLKVKLTARFYNPGAAREGIERAEGVIASAWLSGRNYLRQTLPARCLPFLPAVLRGDFLAAQMVTGFYNVTGVTRLCLELMDTGCGIPACRALLQAAWSAGNPYVVQAAGDPHRLANLLSFAGLPHPEGDPVKLWRGATPGFARGHCWTDDYDVACHFAYRRSSPGDERPIVVSAWFPASEVYRLPDIYTPQVSGSHAREYVVVWPPEEVEEVTGRFEDRALSAALVGLSAWASLPERFTSGRERLAAYAEEDPQGTPPPPQRKRP
ncbi:hypothetical protein [Halomonas sp. H5]|uniref:hypothetical protein n=1 Tax=Halomonas sp. H5 TaxID=3423910 RepID=UPI003D369CB6